ncbi:MAG: hypothetical protein ACRDU9_07185 [Acidimicrobiia bacterium]
MSDGTVDGRDLSAAHADVVELRKEAYAMALYVAICLLAALTVVSERHGASRVDDLKLVWGTTVGLAVAHWFAFRVSARLVASGTIRRHDVEAAAAQLVGAVAVALFATIPALILPDSVELDVIRLALAGFIGVVGYAVARGGGATVGRSVVYGVSILVIAAGVAALKNLLVGH